MKTFENIDLNKKVEKKNLTNPFKHITLLKQQPIME